MNEIFLNVEDLIKELLPKTLRKNLQDNEQICPHCKGLGIVLERNSYGISNDPDPKVKNIHFPYEHQSFTFCPHCYNGVQNLCQYCKKPIVKGHTQLCDCKQYKESQLLIKQEKMAKIIEKAKEIKPEETNNMLYCEELDEFFNDISCFLDFYENKNEPMELPARLWVTSSVELSLDAYNILENACEELHEDALENCNVEELQNLLNEYVKQQTGTTTYYPNYKEYVLIKKESLEEVFDYLDSDTDSGDVIKCFNCGKVSLHQTGGTCCGNCEEENFEIIEKNVSRDFINEKGYILIDC